MNVKQALGKNWRYLFFIAATMILFWALFTWRMALLPFMIGLLLAYLLLPVVRWIEELLPFSDKWEKARRPVSAFIVIIVFLGLVALIIFAIISDIVRDSTALLNNASQIITNFGDRFTTWSKEIREHLPPNLQSELDTIIKDAGNGFTNSITGFVGGGGSVFSRITSSFGLILGFAAMPLFVFYILKDFEHIQDNIYSALPPVVAGHTRNIVNIIDRVLGQYLRAQVVLGIIVAVATYFVLSLLKVPYALPLAFFNGLFAIIPSIGPIIGGIIIMLVVLSEAAAKAIPVLILIIAIELIKTLFLVPKVTADRLHLHASLVITLLVLGAYFWGVWGVIFVVPVVATLVEVFNYVRAVSRNELTGEQSRILKAGGRTEFLRAKKR